MRTNTDSSHTLHRFLQVYRIEPFGRLLSGRLHLPMPVVWFVWVFLYFGILLILHSAVGTPRPTEFKDIFRNPTTNFYYPNLIGVAYDLIGHPLLFVILIFFRNHIPSQFTQLEQSGFIKENLAISGRARFLHLLGTSHRIQVLLVLVFPLAISISGVVVDILVSSPQGVPALYVVFLSLLGRYGRLVTFVQLCYIFVILANYKFSFRLQLNHPDECSGLAPFGKLAIGGYIYLFIFAMMQAIGTAAGGGSFERALGSAVGTDALIYLWILFPFALILIFSELIYGPHQVLRNLQLYHLWTASRAWTKYHRQLTSNIVGAVEQSEVPLADKSDRYFSEDLELLDVWVRLNKYIEKMHTWPISKRMFRAIAVLANPLIPMLLPAVVDVFKDLLR